MGRVCATGVLPLYLAFFLIGVHAAHYKWYPSAHCALGFAGAAGAFVVLSIAWPVSRTLLVEGSFSNWLSDYNPAACIVLAVLVAPYAMARVRRALPRQSVVARIDRDLSNITYEVYLLHWSLVLPLQAIAAHASRYTILPLILLSWVAVFPLSWIIYVFVDRPIDRMRSRYVKSQLIVWRGTPQGENFMI